MRIIVTGGMGFIGSHVIDHLARQDHDLLIIDNMSRSAVRRSDSAGSVLAADIKSVNAADAVQSFRPDVIVHLAAQVSVIHSVERPMLDLDENVIGTVNLLTAARTAGVKKFIFSSSGGAVYGDQDKRPTTEDAAPLPQSPYGISKRCAEYYVEWFARQSSMSSVILRFSNVYGPRQGSSGEGGVISVFTREMLAGRHPMCFGDGLQTRDYIHVSCVARAIVNAACSRRAEGYYNVSSGVEVNLRALAKVIAQQTKFAGSLRYAPGRRGEVRYSSLDNEKAIRELHWSPEIALEGGVKSVSDWLQGESNEI